MTKYQLAKQKENDAYRAWMKERGEKANLAMVALMALPEPSQAEKDSANKVWNRFMSKANGKRLAELQGN